MRSFISIQYLRGVAASLVLIFHAVQAVPSLVAHPFTIGESGVDLFFVISGFVMWSSTAGAAKTPVEFYRARVRRIVPLYWICTLAYLLIEIFGHLLKEPFNYWDLVYSLFFIPYNNAQLGLPVPILSPGWTLNYEAFFYVIFGAALLIKNAPAKVAILFSAFAIMSAARPFVDQSNAIAFRFTSPLFFEFFAGIILAIVAIADRSRTSAISSKGRTRMGMGLILVAIAVLVRVPVLHITLPRTVEYGVPATILVMGGLLLEPLLRQREITGLRTLGDASYSLYLTHLPVIYAVGRVLDVSLVNAVVFVGLEIFFSLVVGILTYRLVEQPLLRSRRPVLAT